MYYKTTYRSPIGMMTLACDGDCLTGLWLEGQKYHGDTLYTDMLEGGDMPALVAAKSWLDRYFAGEKPCASQLKLRPDGSGFRRAVWDILTGIPYGQVMTYGDIAKIMAAKTQRPGMSSRAVGGAVGHNPISVIIPCHRVVGSDGSLTGYAGGVKAKARLLELEGVVVRALPRAGRRQ